MASLATMKNNVAGFTILELLIAIAVIGIISAIAAPNISSWTKSRTVKKELAYVEALIDYSKATSVSKSRKLYLRQTSASAIQLFQLKTGTDALNAENLNNSTCNFVANNTEAVEQYPTVSNFTSTLKAQHNSAGNAGSNLSFPNETSLMCFYSNGQTSGGGFLIAHDCMQFRTQIFLTGFYSKEIDTNITCVGARDWIERN